MSPTFLRKKNEMKYVIYGLVQEQGGLGRDDIVDWYIYTIETNAYYRYICEVDSRRIHLSSSPPPNKYERQNIIKILLKVA